MASIEQCPDTTEKRTSRSNINKCPALENYHCLKTEDGQLRELCTSPIWIEAGKCPIYSSTGKLDARICRATPSRKCPTNVYKSNLNFNYPGCLPNVRSKTPTQHINGEQTTQNSSLTLSGSGEEGSYLAVIIVVPILVVFFVILAIAWLKRKEIRKWIRDFAQSIRSTESDVEAVGTSKCPATQASTVSQATDENKAEGQQSGHDHGSQKKTKENIQARGTDHQENQSLLNADDLAKENSEKKSKRKKSKAPEKKPEFTPGSNGKHKSAEKTEENIQTSDKTHEENQSLLNADESATVDVPNKTPNRKKLKEPRNSGKSLLSVFTKKSSGKSKETENVLTSNGENIENQTLLDQDDLIKVSAEHFGEQRKNDGKNADSVSTQDKVFMSSDKGVSAANIYRNQTPKTHNEKFIKTMADLLLDKDVLVLISSVANERIELAQAISLKACENTKGANIRMVNGFHDLRHLEKEQLTIVSFIYDTFEPEKTTPNSAVYDTSEHEKPSPTSAVHDTPEPEKPTPKSVVHDTSEPEKTTPKSAVHDTSKPQKPNPTSAVHDTPEPEKPTLKSAVHDTFQIIQDAMKKSNNKIHALFSFPNKECNDFIKKVKKSSLKFAVYDLSTMQERKTKQRWIFF